MFKMLSNEQWAGVLRTVLAAVAGLIAAKGWADADLVYGVAGVAGTGAIALWSVVQKYLSAKALGDGSEVQVAANAVKAALALLQAAAEKANALDATAKLAQAEVLNVAVNATAPAFAPAAPLTVEPVAAEPAAS